MCQIQSLYFTVNGIMQQPPCAAHGIDVTSNIEAKAEVAFFSNETNQSIYVYFQIERPDGSTFAGYANNGNSYFIGNAGTYVFTIGNFVPPGYMTGTWNIATVIIYNGNKSAQLCCGGSTTTTGCPLPINNIGCQSIYLVTSTTNLASITIDSTLTFQSGSTATLTPICKNSSGTILQCPSLIWTSNSTNLTVNNGILSSSVAGTYTVYASYSGVNSNYCNVTVTGGVANTYSCINNSCIPYTCTIGSPNCYTASNCNNVCTSGGGTSGCTNCDLTKNYCISGNCIPKTYLLGGAVLFFAVMMFRR